jgi:hypothetical protein
MAGSARSSLGYTGERWDARVGRVCLRMKRQVVALIPMQVVRVLVVQACICKGRWSAFVNDTPGFPS